MKNLTKWNFGFIFTSILVGFTYANLDLPIEIGTIVGKRLWPIITTIPDVDIIFSIWHGYEELKSAIESHGQLTESQQIAVLAAKVDKISQSIKYYHDDLSTSLAELDFDIKLKMDIDKLKALVADIINDYSVLMFTFDSKGNVVSQDINKQAQNNIRRHNKMLTKLIALVDYLADAEPKQKRSNIFRLLLNSELKNKIISSSQVSVQQLIYGLYQKVVDAQVKGLLMLLYAHQENKKLSSIEKQKEINRTLSGHFGRIKDITNCFADSIEEAPGDMWMYDPGYPKNGTTYEKFGRVFQKYLYNEKNSNPDPIKRHLDNITCGECVAIEETIKIMRAKYKLEAKYKGDVEVSSNFMPEDFERIRCKNGFIRSCDAHSDVTVHVCTAGPGKVERYSYIEFEDAIYGNKEFCLNKVEDISRPEVSPWDWAPPLVEIPRRCLYCMCTCVYDDSKEKTLIDFQRSDVDRYIDLRPVLADLGHVVTGVRLTKNNETHTFYLQIKQARLLANGSLWRNHWKNASNYYPRTPENSWDMDSPPKYEQDVDYHKVTWEVTTAFYLGNIVASRDNQVVTGVRFQTKSKDGKIYVALAVKFSGINFVTGNFTGREEWHSEHEKLIPYRHEVKIDDLDVPIRYNLRNTEIKDDGSSVQLVNSGLKVDVGQNILPFIDIQNVDTDPPVPLAGVGLYHRGIEGSGGYLGLKAHIFDLTNYLPNTTYLESLQQKLLDSTHSEAE